MSDVDEPITLEGEVVNSSSEGRLLDRLLGFNITGSFDNAGEGSSYVEYK